MFVGNSTKLIGELKQHIVDMVIVSEPLSDDRFIVKPFIDDELLVIVSPQHKWADKTINIEELLNEPFVDREPGSGTREMYKKFFDSKGLSRKDFKVIMTMGSVEAVKSYVESGFGYGIVSNIAVEREIRSGLLKHVKIKGESLKRKFLIVYPFQQYNKHLISHFSDFIFSTIKTS
jgi:DNA-binding transcriptional LysR family regulator